MTCQDATGPGDARKRGWMAGCLLGMVLSAAALWAGCATPPQDKGSGAQALRRITDLLTTEDQTTVTLVIRGDQPLTYSAVKQSDPVGLNFQFPDTALEGLKSVYFPPPNKVIRAIRLTESGGGEPGAQVFLELIQDAPYTVTRDQHDLRVVFTPPAAPATKPKSSPARKPATRQVPAVPDRPKKDSSVMKQVTVATFQDGVVIHVTAEGPVQGVKAFTVDENPAKIVFDLAGMRSVYSGEQRIAVQSPWVSLVRHFGHADKVRLVAETSKAHFNDYSVDPVPDGLVIRIGRKPVSSAASRPTEAAKPADPASGGKP
jgi:AMIN domain